MQVKATNTLISTFIDVRIFYQAANVTTTKYTVEPVHITKQQNSSTKLIIKGQPANQLF